MPSADVDPAVIIIADDPAYALAEAAAEAEAWLSAWRAQVRARTGSARTPAEYERYVRGLLAIEPNPAAATPAHLHAFAYAPLANGRPPSASTITVRLAALRSWFDFLVRMGALASNPAKAVARPASTPPIPRGLTMDETRRLLAVVPDTRGGLRDRAVILTMLLAGLRRSEVFALHAGSLEADDDRICYRVRVKGGQERRRELPGPAVQAIAAYWADAGTSLAALSPETPLFPITPGGFYQNLRGYAWRAGLPGLKPHDLRHTAAKLRREHGASLEEVQALLGHRSVATTARYLVQLEGERDPGWKPVAQTLGLA